MKALKKTTTWKWFSLYSRLKRAVDGGYVRCFTCGSMKYFRDMEAGHYIHTRPSVFFAEINVNCQCTKCNRFLNGKLDSYYEHLVRIHGKDQVELLKFESNKIKKYTKFELKAISDLYRKKAKELAKRLGVEL